MNQLEQNLDRILKVRDVDLGLFILAMHSLMEKTLKEKYNITEKFNSNEKDDSFGQLIIRYKNEYRENYGDIFYRAPEKRNTYNGLKEIYENHFLSNDVRHRFEMKSIEDAQSTVKCFLAFADAENWSYLEAINKLKRELNSWDTHSDFQSEELKKAIAQIKQLKNENENLAEKVNTLEDLQNQLNVLASKENVLRTELAEAEARLSKKDEKVDKLRKKSNEQFTEFQNEKKKILEKLKEFESTKEYISHLEKVAFYTKTRHDYESSVTRLTSEQAEVLDQIKLTKDYLVKGSAGTGKSLVLLKTLEKAINEIKSEFDFDSINNHFRLLTYTKSLVKYNQYVTKIMGTEVPEDTITTADKFLFAMMRKFFPSKRLCFNMDNSLEPIFDDENFDAKTVFVECSEFIWSNCISKEDYLDKVCERSGMKTAMKKEERIKMWAALENVEKQLETHNLWPRNFAAKKLIDAMDAAKKDGNVDFCAEYSFVDEAQDLSPVMLSLIKNATNRGVFLAGDSDQSIYRKGFNWNKSGIDIRGRTKILKMNFRNTNQIHEFAENYRKKFKNMDKTTNPSAFRPGPPVELTKGKNQQDSMQQIVQQVKLLLNVLRYEEENICTIANQKSKLEKLQGMLDKELGVNSFQIDNPDFDFSETKGIRLCTMQNCKGLDFPVVLFLADHRIQGAEQGSVFDSETYYEQQYNMVYVCLTRAMEMLHIFTVESSEFAPFKDLLME